MDIVLIITFLVTFISGTAVLRLTLKIKNILSYIIPTIIALVVTEMVYIMETMMHFGPSD